MNAALLVALAAAVAAPLVAYVTASKKLSGRIGTTEANKLWEVTEAMRVDYIARIATLEARIAAVEAKNEALTLENAELRRVGNELRHKLEGSSND